MIRFVKNCNMRLVAGILLLFSGAVFGLIDNNRDHTGSPTEIQTISGKLSACRAKSVETPFGRLGCSNVNGLKKVGTAVFMRPGGSKSINR